MCNKYKGVNKFSLNLRGAMEAHQTSNLGVLSSSLSEDVFILFWRTAFKLKMILYIIIRENNKNRIDYPLKPFYSI